MSHYQSGLSGLRRSIIARLAFSFRPAIALLFVAALAPLNAFGESKSSVQPLVMLPGLWEITVQTHSPITGPAIVRTVCIAKGHSARPDPPKTKPADDCQVLPSTASAAETAYTVHCAKQKVTTTARFTYAPDHFEGTVTIKNNDGELQQTYSAKRIGDCDDETADAGIVPRPQ